MIDKHPLVKISRSRWYKLSDARKLYENRHAAKPHPRERFHDLLEAIRLLQDIRLFDMTISREGFIKLWHAEAHLRMKGAA